MALELRPVFTRFIGHDIEEYPEGEEEEKAANFTHNDIEHPFCWVLLNTALPRSISFKVACQRRRILPNVAKVDGSSATS